jgi:TctA family transporter
MHRKFNIVLFIITLALAIAGFVYFDIVWPQSALFIVIMAVSLIGIYSQHKDNKNDEH